jgi:hypothetical protein
LPGAVAIQLASFPDGAAGPKNTSTDPSAFVLGSDVVADCSDVRRAILVPRTAWWIYQRVT